MTDRNISLKEIISGIEPKESLIASLSVPEPDSTNIQGHEAYSQDKWLTFLTMINTLKFESQYYRSIPQQIMHFRKVFHDCAMEDPYLTAQCLVYSRCVSDGMRTVTQLGASMLPQYINGQSWLKNFFSTWDKKAGKGGIIFRADDMFRIVQFVQMMNGSSKLPMALKKGFKSNLENLDRYSILKYKRKLYDVINLIHPDPNSNPAHLIEIEGQKIPVLNAVIQNKKTSADTWEVAQSEAGQIVAQAKKEGKLDEEGAKVILDEAKLENWKGLLAEKKLGMLAALRNLRSILSLNPDSEIVDMLTLLIENQDLIRQGKIMPHQFDLAIESLMSMDSNPSIRKVIQSLQKSYEESIPNLKDILSGNNLILLDCSGSMHQSMNVKKGPKSSTNCMDKAKLIAATIAKATNADIVQFGSHAKFAEWNPGDNVFSIADSLVEAMGGTDLHSAWKFASQSGRKYDRVFIISDNECNIGKSYKGYQRYVEKISDPYVYSIDLAGYGSNCLAGPKVRYYYGYGYQVFDDLVKSEFNPEYHLEKVRKIIL